MKLRTAIATATTAAILASSGVAIAGASGDSTPQPTAKPAASAPAAQPAAASRRAGGFARRLRVRALIRRGAAEIITKTIGIDRPTLRSGLTGGQTIAQIATAHGVLPQMVIDALVTAANTKLDAAVAKGRIKADRATKIEAKLPARVADIVNNWHPKRLRNVPAS